MYNKHHDQLKKLTGEGKLAEITKLNKMLSSFKKNIDSASIAFPT